MDLDLGTFLTGLVEDDEFADVVNGDTLYKDVKEVKDNGIRSYESITYRDLLPNEGYHLGLDLSKNSTGITVSLSLTTSLLKKFLKKNALEN